MKIAILLVFVTVACVSQTPVAPRKKTTPKKPPESTVFICPEPEAKQACQSYDELRKAKDPAAYLNDYVCFRRNTDEFFVVWFGKPHFKKKWNPERKQLVIENGETEQGLGFTETYANGVNNSRVLPNFSFSGTWVPTSPYSDSSANFTSDKVNKRENDEKDKITGVYIDQYQFQAAFQYKNAVDETIDYVLTIQRSTGRFAENFTEEPKKVPFSENVGRCISAK
jgi:hypothetical protein